MCVCVCVCVCVSDTRFIHFALGSCYIRCAHKRIVNIMKVYIERNNMQGEFLRFRKKIAFIHVYFCETRNSTILACLRLDSRYNISMFDP